MWADGWDEPHLHHNLPMTMTSTTSPLCSSTYCSVLGGSISRPLALRIDINLLDTWLPRETRRQIFIYLFYKWRNSTDDTSVGNKVWSAGILEVFHIVLQLRMPAYLCFVPRAVAPDDARWECSDGTPVEDPVLRHMKAEIRAAVFSIKFAFTITTELIHSWRCYL